MQLFNSQLVRSFVIGFALGTVVVFTSLHGDSHNPVVTEAVAATPR